MLDKQRFTIMTGATEDDLAEFIAARIEEGSYVCVVTRTRDIYYDRRGQSNSDWLVVWEPLYWFKRGLLDHQIKEQIATRED
jgi:hypothetical protein